MYRIAGGWAEGLLSGGPTALPPLFMRVWIRRGSGTRIPGRLVFFGVLSFNTLRRGTHQPRIACCVTLGRIMANTDEAASFRFPGWFVSDCPPADAGDASGTIYRFVANKTSVEQDFESYHETGQVPNGPPCERCGLSVFRKLDDVREMLRHLWRRYPGNDYGPHVVKRELTSADGKIKPTRGRGHHTWWAYDQVTRHAAFEYVETVSKK